MNEDRDEPDAPASDTGPAEPPGRMVRALRRARVQTALSTVVAVAAILLALWEGMENRQHNRLSVAPHVSGGTDLSNQLAALRISSDGLGPAVLQDFRVFLDGDVVLDARAGGSWTPVLEAFPASRFTVNMRAFGYRNMLRAGDDHTLFEARPAPGAPPGAFAGDSVIARLAVQICYCSVYGDACDGLVIGTLPRSPPPCSEP